MKRLFTLLICITVLGASAQTYLDEDFSSGLPSTWSQVTPATDGGFLAGDAATLSSTYFNIDEHGDFVATNDDGCNCDKSEEILKTPALDFTSATDIYLVFEYFYLDETYQTVQENAEIQISTDGGSTFSTIEDLSASNGWATLGIDLSAYAGMSNVVIGFVYQDGGEWLWGLAIDDVKVYELPSKDIRLTSVGRDTVLLNQSAHSVTGVVTNMGTDPITEFTVAFDDGTTNETHTFTGVSIGSFDSYSFTHPNAYAAPLGKKSVLDVTATIVDDAEPANNNSELTVYNIEDAPVKNVFFEEATGTWCGWCPRGHVYMEQLTADYPERFIGVAVHNGDPMVVNEYDDAIGDFIGGYPSGLADRMGELDPSQFDTAFSTLKQSIALGQINVDAEYSGNQVTITTTTYFAYDGENDRYNVLVVPMENEVTGTSSDWAQVNYYAGGSSGAMGGYESLPDPVPASQMVYDNVARDLLGGWDGESITPTSIERFTPFTKTFTWTMDTSVHDINHMEFVAVLLDANTGYVVNASKNQAYPTGVHDVADQGNLFIYPNPASDVITINWNATSASDEIQIEIYNMLGEKVYVAQNGPTGLNTSRISVKNWPKGMYQVVLAGSNSQVSKSIVVQ